MITPIVLGMCVGGVVSGGVGAALSGIEIGVAAGLPVPGDVPRASFTALYIHPWISPFTVAVGFMTLALVSFLAATYLTIEADGQRELQGDFRRRAIGAAIAAMTTATIALALGAREGGVMARLVGGEWSPVVFTGSAVAAIVSVAALITRRYRLARIAAAGWVTFVLWGWVLAQIPLIIPPSLTIDAASAPPRTLVETMAVLVGGGIVLAPSLWYLLRVFKFRRPA